MWQVGHVSGRFFSIYLLEWKKIYTFASEMKKVVLLIWLLAMGYGLLANEDPYALRQEALRDFDQG